MPFVFRSRLGVIYPTEDEKKFRDKKPPPILCHSSVGPHKIPLPPPDTAIWRRSPMSPIPHSLKLESGGW